MPSRFAIGMQDAGWWVRSEVVWHKTNPMPESIRDRPGTAHEKVFLFTRSQRYFYDAAAVRTALAPTSTARLAQELDHQAGSLRANGGTRVDRPMKAVRGRSNYGRHTLGDALPDHEKRRGLTPRHEGHINHTRLDKTPRGEGANLRNVWSIATRPFKEAHFATFPPDLPEICIKAGCPRGGTVLDPFGGAGTTGLVAQRLGRNAILIELNPAYAALAKRRIKADLVA